MNHTSFLRATAATAVARLSHCNYVRLSVCHTGGLDSDNLRKKFSALNIDFSSPILDPLMFKEACARGRQKGVPPKQGRHLGGLRGLRTPRRIYDFSFFSVNCTID